MAADTSATNGDLTRMSAYVRMLLWSSISPIIPAIAVSRANPFLPHFSVTSPCASPPRIISLFADIFPHSTLSHPHQRCRTAPPPPQRLTPRQRTWKKSSANKAGRAPPPATSTKPSPRSTSPPKTPTRPSPSSATIPTPTACARKPSRSSPTPKPSEDFCGRST